MKDKKKKIPLLVGLLILVLGIVGISYAFFFYYRLGNNTELIAGEIYLTLNDGTLGLSLPNVFPETVDEARKRADNVLTFSINGKNTTTNKDIYYEIMLNEGDSIAGKTRYKASDLVFDLVEVTSSGEEYLVNAQSFDDINAKRIWVDTVSKNTTSELTRTYKLRMWLSEDVLISDTNENANYTTGEYKNSYANVKISVYGDFVEKKMPGPLLSSTLETRLAANLTEPDVDGTRYVTGATVDNNYVWYSGKLWRVVALNSDGTVKLVTQNPMTTIAWTTMKGIDYNTSQIHSWLNTEFLPTINSNLLVDSKWDYTTYASFPSEKITENQLTVTDKVGLLSVYEYMMTGGTIDYNTSSTFLNNGYFWWTMSPNKSGYIVYLVSDLSYAISGSPTGSYGVRPSVTLKSDITLIEEVSGTIENPYMLEGDTQTGKANELLSTRLSGEYIKFNNVRYRIVGVENGLTKITMADYNVNQNTLSTEVQFGASEDELTFSTAYGIGKYLDDWYNATSENDTSGTYTGLYLSETYKDMIATPSDGVRWYAGPDTGTDYDYTKAKEGTAIEATIGSGRYGEMFSSQFGEGQNLSHSTWLITKRSSTSVWYNSYTAGFSDSSPTSSHRVRPSFYLKANVKITGGTGMPHDAYTISQ